MARQHRRPSGVKRQVTWVGPADQGFVAVATGAKVILASFDPVSFGMDKPTVIRTRGQVAVRPEITTADLDLVGAIGLGIVSDEAFAAGVAAIPGPFDSADWDGWFVWQSFSYNYEFIDGTGFNFSVWNFEVDSKAMRKVSDGETMVVVIESQVGAMRISAPLRTLWKLS